MKIENSIFIPNEIALSKLNYLSWVLALATFMPTFDTTVLNVSIPTIATSVGILPENLKNLLISYLLGYMLLIPINGWLCSKFSAKRVFITAIVIFTLSSLLCGFSINIYELTIARFLQGLSGALILPTCRLIVVNNFREHSIAKHLNQLMLPALIGTILGPSIGSLITNYFSWHWIFFINVPFGVGIVLISIYLIPSDKQIDMAPFNFIGYILFSLSLCGTNFILSVVNESQLSLNQIMVIIACSISAFIVYLIYNKIYQQISIIKLNLFKISTFRLTMIMTIVYRLIVGGLPFVLPIYLQLGIGLSLIHAGLLLLSIGVGAIVVKNKVHYLLKTYGFGKLLFINTIILSVSIMSFALIKQTTPIVIIALVLFCHGVILSIQHGSLNPLAYADIPSNDLNEANSLITIVQQLSIAISVTLWSALIQYFTKFIKHANVINIIVFNKGFIIAGTVLLISSIFYLYYDKTQGIELLK